MSWDRDATAVLDRLLSPCRTLPSLKTVVLSYLHNVDRGALPPSELAELQRLLTGVDAALVQLRTVDTVVLRFVDEESGEESNAGRWREFLSGPGATFFSTLGTHNKMII